MGKVLSVNAFPCGVVVVFPALGFDVDADAIVGVLLPPPPPPMPSSQALFMLPPQPNATATFNGRPTRLPKLRSHATPSYATTASPFLNVACLFIRKCST
jgi:hypothetical protein